MKTNNQQKNQKPLTKSQARAAIQKRLSERFGAKVTVNPDGYLNLECTGFDSNNPSHVEFTFTVGRGTGYFLEMYNSCLASVVKG